MNKKKPLVSIIMNCHNGEQYLRESISSVINQKYKNWELIFFDNNSEDQSVKIAKSFFNKKIRVFKSRKFLKLYEARNNALKYAKGKYVSFLDTDDLWSSTKLKIQVQYLLKKKIKFVFSNFYYLKKKKRFINKKITSFKEGYICQDLLNNYGIGILTVLVSKEFFKKKLFDKKYDIIGDFDYFINLSLDNYFGYIDRPLAQYRIHDQNLSKKKFSTWIKELESWINKNETSYNRKGISLNSQKKYLKRLKIKKFIKKFLK